MVSKSKSFLSDPISQKKAQATLQWMHLTDSEVQLAVLNAALHPESVGFYNLLIINPLNEFRILAALLDLMEDLSLKKLGKLMEAEKIYEEIKYPTILDNIFTVFQEVYFKIGFRVPTRILTNIMLPAIK